MAVIHRMSKLAATTSLTGQDTQSLCCVAPCNLWAVSQGQLTRSVHILFVVAVVTSARVHDTALRQVSERVYRILDEELSGAGKNLLPKSLTPLHDRLQQSEGGLSALASKHIVTVCICC